MKIVHAVVVDDEIVETFSTGFESEAYQIARYMKDKTHEEALECVSIFYNVWLKDQNPTEIGHLIDFIIDNYEEIKDKDTKEILYMYY